MTIKEYEAYSGELMGEKTVQINNQTVPTTAYIKVALSNENGYRNIPSVNQDKPDDIVSINDIKYFVVKKDILKKYHEKFSYFKDFSFQKKELDVFLNDVNKLFQSNEEYLAGEYFEFISQKNWGESYSKDVDKLKNTITPNRWHEKKSGRRLKLYSSSVLSCEKGGASSKAWFGDILCEAYAVDELTSKRMKFQGLGYVYENNNKRWRFSYLLF